jgi:hypothetical protein
MDSAAVGHSLDRLDLARGDAPMIRATRYLRPLPLAGLVALALGCSHPLAVRTGEAPIQTDRAEYVADRAEGGVQVDIPFRFTNPTRGPVNLPTCHGVHPPTLEKLVEMSWVRAYSPIVLQCLGPPFVVARGASYDYTLRLQTYRRGSNTYPQFELEIVPGTYRLVWTVFEGDGSRYATSGPGPLLPTEQRVSNSFRITE